MAYVFPAALADAGKIIDTIYNNGLTITELRMVTLSSGEASALVSDGQVAGGLSSGPCLAMKLTGESPVEKWAALSANKPAVAGSTSVAAAEAEANFIFGTYKLPAPSGVDASSLLLVRPHAVRDGKLGLIVHQLIS